VRDAWNNSGCCRQALLDEGKANAAVQAAKAKSKA
jgi:hypothetical protein